MSVSLILEMAESIGDGSDAIVDGDHRLSVSALSRIATHGAGLIASCDVQHVVYVGTGGALLPTLMFASARAGIPLTPLNYRLSPDALRSLIERLPRPLIVADSAYVGMLAGVESQVMTAEEFLQAAPTAAAANQAPDPDDVAVVLFTSGTTSRPKAVELTHQNLTSYIMGTVEFASAQSNDAALVCVPPYHIAGVGACLSNLYAGRKVVYLRQFDAVEWLRTINVEGITTATVVPTMLDRIVTALERDPVALPTLRNLAYGGSKVGLPLIRKALELMPDVGFANAYGLTETSSTVAVLTPEDHAVAHASNDPAISKRLGSVGRAVPGLEVQIRTETGTVLGPNEPGELFVRGAQVSGTYSEIGSVLDEQGWFPTKDLATVDADGYLFIAGRQDDTIIRGGENIAPAEIEDVLVEHPQVHACAVVGPNDPEWGQSIVAVVVPVSGAQPDPGELCEFVRRTMRGSRTPDRVVFRAELPTNPTGKVLRRELVADLESAAY